MLCMFKHEKGLCNCIQTYFSCLFKLNSGVKTDRLEMRHDIWTKTLAPKKVLNLLLSLVRWLCREFTLTHTRSQINSSQLYAPANPMAESLTRRNKGFIFIFFSFASLKPQLLSFNVSWHKADKLARTSSGENSTFTSEAVFFLLF